MNTTIADKSLSSASSSGHPEAPQNSGFHTSSTPDHAAFAHSSPVPAEDARHFAAAMGSADTTPDNSRSAMPPRKYSAQPKEERSDKKQDTRKDANHDEREETPFASLFAGRFEAGTAAPQATVAVASPAEPLLRDQSLAEQLAERILVSESSAAGQEVRILPSRDILPDTEICLVRGADGLLSAVIHTDNPASFQTLAAAQHDLRTRLEESEGQEVHVELRSDADDADPRRRSRGLDLLDR